MPSRSQTNYVAHLAQILPGNTIIFSLHVPKLKTLCQVKIVFYTHKDHTWTFIWLFSDSLPYNLKMV